MFRLVTAQPTDAMLKDLPLSRLSTEIARGDRPVWLDFTKPSADEIQTLQESFGFHPLAIEDAIREEQRPKVDIYNDHYFVVFYCAHYETEGAGLCLVPVHLFIGRNFLVTIHQGPIPTLEQTATRWRAPQSPLGRNIGALVHALLDAIVDNYFPVLDEFADRVDDLQEQMFKDFDQRAIEQIFQFKKDLIALRRTVGPERDVLNILLRREIPVFTDEDVIYVQDVYDHVLRVTDTVDSYRDLVASALDVFYSVQSSQLNQILKVLTITSIILMSVTLVAGIYGMNFRYMPELEWRYGYPFALSLMVLISVGLITFFRRKRWL